MKATQTCQRVVFLVVLSVLFMGNLAWAQDQRVTVAVFDFDLPSDVIDRSIEISDGQSVLRARVSEVVQTNILTDKFITALVKTNRVKVVERNKLNSVLEEHMLKEMTSADSNNSIKVGKLIHADLMLFGSIDNFELQIIDRAIPYTDMIARRATISFGVSVRMVDAKSGQVVSANSILYDYAVPDLGKLGITGRHIQMAENELVDRLVDEFQKEIFPIKVVHVNETQVYMNAGVSQKVNVGDQYAIYRKGQVIIDPDSGLTLGYEQIQCGMVQVERVQPRMSIARILDVDNVEHAIQLGDLCSLNRKAMKDAYAVQPPQVKSRVNKLFN